jgi:DNA modification methylase
VETNIIYTKSAENMSEVEDNSIDLIVTSPPYNLSIDYDKYDDTIPYEEYVIQLKKIWQECYRVLKTGGRFVVNSNDKRSGKEYLPTHINIYNQLVDIGFKMMAEIIWNKQNYNCSYTTWGSWKLPSSPYIKTTWEYVDVFYKNEYKHPGDRALADISREEFMEWTTGMWKIGCSKVKGHPATFPINLVERLLKLYTYKKDIVLDPFIGSGTTAVACKLFDRQYIGYEINPEYVKLSLQRIKDGK